MSARTPRNINCACNASPHDVRVQVPRTSTHRCTMCPLHLSWQVGNGIPEKVTAGPGRRVRLPSLLKLYEKVGPDVMLVIMCAGSVIFVSILPCRRNNITHTYPSTNQSHVLALTHLVTTDEACRIPCCSCIFRTQNFTRSPISMSPPLAGTSISPVGECGPLSISCARVELDLMRQVFPY